MMAGGWLPLAVRLAVDLDLSATQLLLLGTSMEVAMLLGEIPTGVVADVFSRKWSVVIGSAETAEPLLLRRGRLEFAATIAAILLFGSLAWVIPRGTSVVIVGGLGVLWTLYLAYAMQ